MPTLPPLTIDCIHSVTYSNTGGSRHQFGTRGTQLGEGQTGVGKRMNFVLNILKTKALYIVSIVLFIFRLPSLP